MVDVRDVEYARVALLRSVNAVLMTQDRGNDFNRLTAILFGLTKVGIATQIEFVDDSD